MARNPATNRRTAARTKKQPPKVREAKTVETTEVTTAANTARPGASAKSVIKTEFAKRLYAAMTKKGWSQSELARKAELGRDSISTYVRGRSMPESKSLKAIADALGIEPEELLPSQWEQSLDTATPAFSMRMSEDDPNRVYLQVNRVVSPATATAIFNALQEDTTEARS